MVARTMPLSRIQLPLLSATVTGVPALGLTIFGWASVAPGTVTSATETNMNAMKPRNLEKLKISICQFDFIKNYSFKAIKKKGLPLALWLLKIGKQQIENHHALSCAKLLQRQEIGLLSMIRFF